MVALRQLGDGLDLFVWHCSAACVQGPAGTVDLAEATADHHAAGYRRRHHSAPARTPPGPDGHHLHHHGPDCLLPDLGECDVPPTGCAILGTVGKYPLSRLECRDLSSGDGDDDDRGTT
ncbi:hypothetical protein VTN77DRAFT_5387 [Rasamsonia byssochlamydoides]|uniref:uncharacterized protein n=1 Tax=Rasamsonia byssochlamydoides TaxID=89139 RepID=UPI003742E10A